jgi:hypothetical protein
MSRIVAIGPCAVVPVRLDTILSPLLKGRLEVFNFRRSVLVTSIKHYAARREQLQGNVNGRDGEAWAWPAPRVHAVALEKQWPGTVSRQRRFYIGTL